MLGVVVTAANSSERFPVAGNGPGEACDDVGPIAAVVSMVREPEFGTTASMVSATGSET